MSSRKSVESRRPSHDTYNPLDPRERDRYRPRDICAKKMDREEPPPVKPTHDPSGKYELCPACHGSGERLGETCFGCHGTGLKNV